MKLPRNVALLLVDATKSKTTTEPTVVPKPNQQTTKGTALIVPVLIFL